MKPLLSMVLMAAALSGCATTAALPPGTVAPPAKAAQVQPGITTRAELLAQLGATTSIRFDNGVEVWRYLLPPQQAQASPQAGTAPAYGEYVVVIDARGIVARTRQAASVYQLPAQK
jgi:outer membrane protein assembly factor BamE (lipoprotein component of BamABCDE complex)